MAWVRYDDNFDSNAKVTAVIAEDPGAIGLHALANTWTNRSATPGFVPAHQPGVLLCDRSLGLKWASQLVRAGLWHERGQECDRCREYYADLPASLVGYVFHDAKDYRPPDRERQTPGTPAEISKKRQEAGRRGGRATAARRESAQQTGPANQANAANGLANQANLDRSASSDDGSGFGFTPVDAAAETVVSETGESGHIKQPARANAANGASKTSKRPANAVSPVPEPVPELQAAASAAAPRAQQTPKLTPAQKTIVNATDATPAEATAIADYVTRDRKPRNLVGLLHTMARDGDLAEMLARQRAPTLIAAAQYREPCNHGQPGGAELHPQTQLPLCPLCRAAA